MIGQSLARAWAAARQAAAARPLAATEPARSSDPPEFEWYYPSSPAVHENAAQLLAAHGLGLLPTTARLDGRRVTSTWRLVHLDSNEGADIEWTSELFSDGTQPPLAMLGTIRHHERAVALIVLGMPVARDGAQVARRPAETQPVEREDLAAEPGWMRVERAQLTREADAAARGEVIDDVERTRIAVAMTTWRTREKKSIAEMRAAAGVPTRGAFTVEDFAKLYVFFTATGDLPGKAAA